MHWRNVPGVTNKKDRKLSYDLKALKKEGYTWCEALEKYEVTYNKKKKK